MCVVRWCAVYRDAGRGGAALVERSERDTAAAARVTAQSPRLTFRAVSNRSRGMGYVFLKIQLASPPSRLFVQSDRLVMVLRKVYWRRLRPD